MVSVVKGAVYDIRILGVPSLIKSCEYLVEGKVNARQQDKCMCLFPKADWLTQAKETDYKKLLAQSTGNVQ
ncbi:hypothetical protein E2C01_015898 [Portunus trituberculatus]|uniref:Uncharacterized protein n=1 Tax=Portunus trituberculatus TaxID=210409 RepID=A0A5B7DMN5_PORTR|nr:hypothetical protein [Portunus trituberculatus]